MPIPQLPGKLESPALFEPEHHLNYFRDAGLIPSFAPPRGVIFCYQRSLLRHIVAQEAATAIPFAAGTLYLLPSSGGAVGVCAEFGIGAPAAALQFELLIALGVSRFINIGTAGGLQPETVVGALTVCTEAIRDEGVSHHYLGDAPAAVEPSPELSSAFADALVARGVAPLHGATWTTDAPFRETHAEIAHYRRQGVLTVEMEAAALFAIAQRRGVAIAGGFAISDSLAESDWQPRFGSPETTTALIRLYEAAYALLQG